MANFDTKKFIELMNKECDANGHSPTFRAGEEAILKSQDPYFVFECIEKIRYINLAKLSEHLAKMPMGYYAQDGVSEEKRLKNYLAIIQSMITKNGVDSRAYISKLLSITSMLTLEELSNAMSRCLRVAESDCPELVPEIIKKLLISEKISWHDFEKCYKAVTRKLVDKFDIEKLNKLFVKNLAIMPVDFNQMHFIDVLIKDGYIDKKEAVNNLLNNKDATPAVKYECFKKLAFDNNVMVQEDYTMLAKQLIREFTGIKHFDTFYEKQLNSYIEQYQREFANEIVTAELNSLIKTMLNPVVEEKTKLDPTATQESNVAKTTDLTNTQETTKLLNTDDLTEVQESNIKI